MPTKKTPSTRKPRGKPAPAPGQPADTSKPVDYFAHTDQGNANRFATAYGGTLRYDHLRGRWLAWQKHYWQQIEDSAVMRAAMKLVADTYDKAATGNHEDLKAWMRRTEDGNHLHEMIRRARCMLPIAVERECWNRDPWLFAVANGVIDLRTGQLRKGKPTDYITMHSPVTFDPSATCPRYDRFHAEIFLNDAEMMRYVARALGYSLTGSVRERCLFICWGSGNNGKGALLGLMRYVLGDYGAMTPASTLAEARNEHAPRNDLARLVSVRMAVANETDLKRGVAESVLKNITGKDRIPARFLHKEFFEFDPEFTLWLSCNNRPPVQGTDDAIWNRITPIPFDAKFTGDGDEKDLDLALRAEAPGILNRLIQYCLDWQREGLGEKPERCKALSAEYRAQSNTVIAFLDAYCDVLPAPVPDDCKEGTAPTALWECYASYMRKLHCKPMDQAAFKIDLEALGYKQKHSKTRRFWQGITITPTETDFDVEV